MEVARQPGVLPLLPQPPPCRETNVVITKSLSFYFTNRDSGARCWGEKRYCIIPCYYYCQLSKQISDSVPHPPNHQALETEGKRCVRKRAMVAEAQVKAQHQASSSDWAMFPVWCTLAVLALGCGVQCSFSPLTLYCAFLLCFYSLAQVIYSDSQCSCVG